MQSKALASVGNKKKPSAAIPNAIAANMYRVGTAMERLS
ncbi:hypothetical protein U91I_03390 [alpha proteobacterium U9-1i]|nr:hypothetical protein U91I_03390 [alpha proteobacterium U9-1i]